MRPVGAMVIGLVLIEILTWSAGHPIVHSAAGTIVLWSGLYGATGRASAVIGALFAFWPVVIVPIVVLIQPAWRDRAALDHWLIMGFGAVAAVTVARTGALQPTVWPALVSVAIAAPASLGLPVMVMAIGVRRGNGGRAASGDVSHPGDFRG